MISNQEAHMDVRIPVFCSFSESSQNSSWLPQKQNLSGNREKMTSDEENISKLWTGEVINKHRTEAEIR